MKESLINKLDTLSDRHEELSALLSDAEIITDQDRYRDLSREYSELELVVQCFARFRQLQTQLTEARALLDDSDAEMRAMAAEEVQGGQAQVQELELELQTLLLPRDPNDSHNIFLEIRAGTGGDEAAIFSGDLFRMYSRFAENQRWSVEVISERPGEHGGYKEIIARVVGQDVYAQLKFESGAPPRAACAGNRVAGQDSHLRLHRGYIARGR